MRKLCSSWREIFGTLIQFCNYARLFLALSRSRGSVRELFCSTGKFIDPGRHFNGRLALWGKSIVLQGVMWLCNGEFWLWKTKLWPRQRTVWLSYCEIKFVCCKTIFVALYGKFVAFLDSFVTLGKFWSTSREICGLATMLALEGVSAVLHGKFVALLRNFVGP